MCPSGSVGTHSPEARSLPRALQRWLTTWLESRGDNSPHSPSTIVGARPDLIPIVVGVSRGSGLKRFLTALATFSALKEAATGELILTLSWESDREDLRSVLGLSGNGGGSEGIGLKLSIPAGELPAMSPSTSSNLQTTGISGVPCDHCGSPFQPRQGYVQIVDPERDAMRLVHRACIKRIDYFSTRGGS